MSILEITLLGIGTLRAMSVSLELLVIFSLIFAMEVRRYTRKCEKVENKRNPIRVIFQGITRRRK